jgi:UDP-N-acetylmuramoyl-tripeptide--D-alanyl-D-alanine ligase
VWAADAIVKGTGGTLRTVDRDVFVSISTDSRTIGPDELFIPLKGPNFDGHLFIDKAYERSHGGALCDRSRPEIYEKAPGTLILVDDTNQALLDLALFKRQQTAGTFVAITGSNGKTTTKELLVHLVGDVFSMVFNQKNFNNQVGVAKALLAIEGSPHFGVFEVGTNHPGEIAVLVRMVRPHIAIITNVNPSHLEGFSDLEGVRKEKVSLFDMTLPGGTILVNADDPSLASYVTKGGVKMTTFAIRRDADCVLRVLADKGLGGFEIAIDFPEGHVETTSRLLGRHNLYNVLAAAVLAHTMGLSRERIAQGIASFDAYKGRFRPVESPRGFIVIDDAYNANPSSMEWAINTLSSLPCKGERIAVLGGMKELGEKTDVYHRALGRTLKTSDLSMILLLGDETKATAEEIGNGRAKHFSNKSELIDFLASKPQQGDIILVKGSRAMGMDEIVEALI